MLIGIRSFGTPTCNHARRAPGSNEMNGVLVYVCTLGIWPREPHADGEMNEMTLPLDTGFEIRALAV